MEARGLKLSGRNYDLVDKVEADWSFLFGSLRYWSDLFPEQFAEDGGREIFFAVDGRIEF